MFEPRSGYPHKHLYFTIRTSASTFHLWSLVTAPVPEHCIYIESLWLCQVKKPAVKKASKVPAKGAGKGVGAGGSKKKKSALKYTVDCTHPVEDGIMDPGNFVCTICSLPRTMLD